MTAISNSAIRPRATPLMFWAKLEFLIESPIDPNLEITTYLSKADKLIVSEILCMTKVTLAGKIMFIFKLVIRTIYNVQ